MRKQVGIIGAGPAGLFLALRLHQAGLDVLVLELRSREYSRIVVKLESIDAVAMS